jgi:iron complex transport system substrate-binding protein
MSNRARCDYELLSRFPGFDSFPAAQSGRIYVVDASAYFARRGPRVVDSLEIPTSIVHPQEFSEFTAREAMLITHHVRL